MECRLLGDAGNRQGRLGGRPADPRIWRSTSSGRCPPPRPHPRRCRRGAGGGTLARPDRRRRRPLDGPAPVSARLPQERAPRRFARPRRGAWTRLAAQGTRSALRAPQNPESRRLRYAWSAPKSWGAWSSSTGGGDARTGSAGRPPRPAPSRPDPTPRRPCHAAPGSCFQRARSGGAASGRVPAAPHHPDRGLSPAHASARPLVSGMNAQQTAARTKAPAARVKARPKPWVSASDPTANGATALAMRPTL